MLPNFLVIGAPRCGTTWISENLRRHPDIFMPQIKEVHFFDRHYEEGLQRYESFFEGWKGQKAVGEATPDYMHGAYSSVDIPSLIKHHLPQAKLVASLRNPIDRAYSRYWNSKAKFEKNSALSFEEKLADRPEFLEEGCYVDQLRRFYELFPREQILVLLYDDLEKDPSNFIRQIYVFLGVDPDVSSSFEHARINTASGKANLARSKLLYHLTRVLSRADLHNLATRLARYNSVQQPKMSDQTRRRLVEQYRAKNQELAQLIGRDLSHWNR